MINVSLNLTLSRAKRSITIMGRSKGDAISFGQLLYVPMQVADIFTLGVDIAHGGMDQRKAHVIAIDIGEKVFGYKPVGIHHHLLIGMHIDAKTHNQILEAKSSGNRELFEDGIIDVKMSKSRPNSAIFIHESLEEIESKIKRAFCPMGDIELNPILELAEHIVFRNIKEPFEVKNKKTGKNAIFRNFIELEKAFASKKIHPLDLKWSVGEKIAEILEPTRRFFIDGKGSKYIEEMNEILKK